MNSLSSYMNSWLYDPLHGYYGKSMVGVGGDFYTSVSVTKFFGGSIALYILDLLDKGLLSLPLKIVEIGSDKGYLISDIAEFMSALNTKVFGDAVFCTVEPLPPLRILQKNVFEKRISSRFTSHNLEIYPDLASLQGKSVGYSIFFVSNELFDSFPCDLVVNDMMVFVENHHIVYRPITSELENFISSFHCLNPEVSIYAFNFIRELTSIGFDKWVFLSFDYGGSESKDTSLRMYKDHRVFNFMDASRNDLLSSLYQHSDITYDVDFSFIRDCFEMGGATLHFYCTQSRALVLELKILEVLEMFSPHLTNQTMVKHTKAVYSLISPSAMGERYRSICFTS